MTSTSAKEAYFHQLEKLQAIVNATSARVSGDSPDKLMLENANFFSKSFFIMKCAYLESYLKDSLMVLVDEANFKLAKSKLAHNLVKWSFNVEKLLKDDDCRFEDFRLKVERKNIDDQISGNPFRTKNLFKTFGIELDKNSAFNSQIERVNSIVVKRNKILHHNDDASDVSLNDILENIEFIKNYIEVIDQVIVLNVSQ